MNSFGIHIRRALEEDCARVYEWRNHPNTRRYFFNSAPIESNIHHQWFTATLLNPSRFLLIAEDLVGRAVGVIRFDQEGDAAGIDIYLVPELHGQGFGGRILAASLNWVVSNTSIRYVCADVIEENIASKRMFITAGFEVDSNRFILKLV